MTTPREPDRFDAQARELRRTGGGWNTELVAAALRAEHASALERAARELAEMKRANTQIQPGKVRHSESLIRGIEIGQAVLRRHIAATKRALIPPAAAPAAETGKAQGAEAPDPERDRNRHNAMLVEAWCEEFNQLCAALYPGNDGLIGWKHIHAKIAELLAARVAPPEREGTT